MTKGQRDTLSKPLFTLLLLSDNVADQAINHSFPLLDERKRLVWLHLSLLPSPICHLHQESGTHTESTRAHINLVFGAV